MNGPALLFPIIQFFQLLDKPFIGALVPKKIRDQASKSSYRVAIHHIQNILNHLIAYHPACHAGDCSEWHIVNKQNIQIWLAPFFSIVLQPL